MWTFLVLGSWLGGRGGWRGFEAWWSAGGEFRAVVGERVGVLSGVAGLGEGHGSRGSLLCGYEGVSSGGSLRDDFTGSAGRGGDPGEHRRGTWAGESEGLRPVPSHRARFAAGTRNASHARLPRTPRAGRRDRSPPHGVRRSRKDAPLTHPANPKNQKPKRAKRLGRRNTPRADSPITGRRFGFAGQLAFHPPHHAFGELDRLLVFFLLDWL